MSKALTDPPDDTVEQEVTNIIQAAITCALQDYGISTETITGDVELHEGSAIAARAAIAALPPAVPQDAAFKAGQFAAMDAMAKQCWHDGLPPKPYGEEWFIAKLDDGSKVVLRELHENHSYDYTTRDETYLSAFRVVKWMQFPDSGFVPCHSPAVPATTPDPVSEAETYYTKGKDARWFANLTHGEFATAAIYAAQDLNDSAILGDAEKWMPIEAIISEGGTRLRGFVPMLEAQAKALEDAKWYNAGFMRVLSDGTWDHIDHECISIHAPLDPNPPEVDPAEAHVDGWRVRVIEWATDETVKVVQCKGEREAKKIERGMGINMASEYYTEIDNKPRTTTTTTTPDPVSEVIEGIIAQIFKLPTRREPISGQTFKYVKRHEVLDILDALTKDGEAG